MTELIDRQAALEIAMGYCPDDDGCCSKAGNDIREMLDELEALPTIESQVRRGRWIFVGEETMHDGWTYRKYKCSECGFQTVEAINFCQNCGKQMDLRTPTEVWLDEADSVMMGGADNG